MASDGSQVGQIAGDGAGSNNLATIEPLEGSGAVLAELARATTSRHRTTRRLRNGLTPMTGPTSRRLRPPQPRAAPGGLSMDS